MKTSNDFRVVPRFFIIAILVTGTRNVMPTFAASSDTTQPSNAMTDDLPPEAKTILKSYVEGSEMQEAVKNLIQAKVDEITDQNPKLKEIGALAKVDCGDNIRFITAGRVQETIDQVPVKLIAVKFHLHLWADPLIGQNNADCDATILVGQLPGTDGTRRLAANVTIENVTVNQVKPILKGFEAVPKLMEEYLRDKAGSAIEDLVEKKLLDYILN